MKASLMVTTPWGVSPGLSEAYPTFPPDPRSFEGCIKWLSQVITSWSYVAGWSSAWPLRVI